MFDFYRVAAIVPEVKDADPEFNTMQILKKIREADSFHPAIIAFPELAVTGYYCQDLFFQKKLQDASALALLKIREASKDFSSVIIVGAPLIVNSMLYNAAYVFQGGELLGVPVKTFIPNYHEFYEKRWFQSASSLPVDSLLLGEIFPNANKFADLDPIDEETLLREVPIGNQIVFDLDGKFKLGVEICEDLWAPLPPSTKLALGGAEVIVNLSASNETIAKRSYRQSLVKHQSAATLSDYIYVSAGTSESTQDLIFSGHSMVAENGTMLNESKTFIADNYILVADMDLEKIRNDRLHSNTFADNQYLSLSELDSLREVKCYDSDIPESDGSFIMAKKKPFVPSSKEKRLQRCTDIFAMQVGGLVKRLEVTSAKPVVGVSGGMDSTLALLVAAMALKKLKRPSTDLVAITMPAFGTTNRTYENSLALIKSLGTEPIVINIKDACIQHLKDLNHDLATHDITFENTQARERTQVLMDYANQCNGLVVGTGDLSELALGWCTYNADQMSMYGVNGSIPKTLVRWLIDSTVETGMFPESSAVLKDILDTPISPELLPPDENGNISQKTEDAVGPYILHDFFMYYSFRFGFSPKKVFFLAKKAFHEDYSPKEIITWMEKYYRRFFSQQFKRSCMPDSVKVGSISLSPRGDWRMPSDASNHIWLQEIEECKLEVLADSGAEA